jgi:serine/threonine protein kinase
MKVGKVRVGDKIEIDMGTRLGSNPYCNIYKGTYESEIDGTIHVAIKHISACKLRADKWQAKALANEIKHQRNLQPLRSPHIVKFYEHVTNANGDHYLVYEFCDNTDLANYTEMCEE